MTSPRKLLIEQGLAAHKARGQNFLADPGLARRIVARADVEPGQVILEIGPGLGGLTRPLLEAGGLVTAVEVDRGLAKFLEDQLVPLFPGRLKLIQEDILKVDLPGLSADMGRPFQVWGNLPYQISTPILFKLLDSRAVLTRAVLMFQKELAERLTAEPGTKAYGRLSVLVRYFARVERLMDLGPEAFHPRPKISSTVLNLTFRQTLEPPVKSESLFRQIVAAGFAQRRKTLKNALASAFPPEQARAALTSAGLDPSQRAETLTINDWAALTNAWPE